MDQLAHWPFVLGQGFGQGPFLKNFGLRGRQIVRGHGPLRGLPPKPLKTIEKSIIRALELLGTSPELSGTAQDHVKAPKSHLRAAQERPRRYRTADPAHWMAVPAHRTAVLAHGTAAHSLKTKKTKFPTGI